MFFLILLTFSTVRQVKPWGRYSSCYPQTMWISRVRETLGPGAISCGKALTRGFRFSAWPWHCGESILCPESICWQLCCKSLRQSFKHVWTISNLYSTSYLFISCSFPRGNYCPLEKLWNSCVFPSTGLETVIELLFFCFDFEVEQLGHGERYCAACAKLTRSRISMLCSWSCVSSLAHHRQVCGWVE